MHRARRLVAAFLVALPLASPAPAQQAPPPSVVVPYAHDTGAVANTGSTAAVVASFLVEVEGAAWLRLFFERVELAGGAELRIVGAADGAEQTLSAATALEWGSTSAYFNGGTLLVEVLSAPGTGPSRVVLAEVVAGLPPPLALSQCGPDDDRVLSADPRVARLLPAGCTAWLFDDCAHCFLTGGHCIGANLVAQFSVPPSSDLGTIVHPPPADQYAFDPLSVQLQDEGAGNDWARFGCFANASTGLAPFARQRSAFVLSIPPDFNGAWTMRVTGYGADFSPPTANYVQQSAAGPWLDATPTMLTYAADTEGGNSGSPVEWVEGGVALAIHTHGGCDAAETDGNRGTSVLHPGLQAALASPRGVCAAACAPSATTYCVAKTNSEGCAPRISFAGTPSAGGGPGAFDVGVHEAIEERAGLLVYGTDVEVTPFLGGMWCLGGALVRTPIELAVGDGSPCSGRYLFDMGGRIASGVDPILVPGATVYAQWWMRDPASPPHLVALSDALAFVIGP